MLWKYLEEEGSDWRQKDAPGNQSVWVVDNTALQSKSKGLRYRLSPDLKDVDRQESAPFGSLVSGVRFGGDWLQCGDRFLPFRLQGVPVLVLESEPEKDTLARSRGFEKWAGSRATRAPARRPPPAEWSSAVQRAEVLNEPFFEPGTGMLYEVVANRVAIRASPEPDAAIQGCEYRGGEVELFDWDETRRWRQVQRPAEEQWKRQEPRAWTLGWMMLDHQEHGPLLRPKGLPFQEQPLQPLHVAVHEDNLVDLQLILLDGAAVDAREPDGKTALMVAVEKGRLDCCVFLIQARADPMQISPEGGSVLDYATEDATKALLQALDPRLPEPDFEPLAHAARALQMEAREAARKLIERVTEERAERARERQLVAERVERARRAREEEEARLDAERRAREEQEERLAREVELRKQLREQELARLEKQAREAQLREAQEAEREAEEEEARKRQEKVAHGELCEVLMDEGVPVHEQPSRDSKLIGYEMLGQVVELHEFDRTGAWRRAKGHEFDGTLSGWMPLVDEATGRQAVASCDDL